MYWMTFLWPWPKVTAVALMNKNLIVCRIKWEPLNQSLQNLVAISLWSSYLIRFWWNSVGNFFLSNFLWKFWMCFFMVKYSIGHISGMAGPNLTRDLDLWFFTVKFKKSCISGFVIWLMWNKKKAHQLDTGLTSWSCPLNTLMTLILCKFQGQSLK